MKHLITKIEYVTEAVRDTHNVNIETDSIEQTRKELHRLMLVIEFYWCFRARRNK